MELIGEDVAVYRYVPDDGSDSAAIRLRHRTSREQVINQDTTSRWHNFRRALIELVNRMNPNPGQIPSPERILFDRVRVNLPQSVHEGQVIRISWNFKRSEWQYFVQCPKEVVSAWYTAADLTWLDEDVAPSAHP